MAENAKVWLITGSSTGFGRSLAEAVLKKGDFVVATARKPEQLNDLVAKYPNSAEAVRLDVTSSQDIRDAVDAAVDAFGRIDVLVNNAGYGTVGAIEEVIPVLCKDALNKIVSVSDTFALNGMIINLFLGEFAALPLLKIDCQK